MRSIKQQRNDIDNHSRQELTLVDRYSDLLEWAATEYI
jgi:hypothetical protein